MGFTSKSMIE